MNEKALIKFGMFCVVAFMLFACSAIKSNKNSSSGRHSYPARSNYSSNHHSTAPTSTPKKADKTTTSPTTSNKSSSYQKNSGSKKYTEDSKDDPYDDGYEAIYLDGDYDIDRYHSDDDYALGVDDALDEFGEDW